MKTAQYVSECPLCEENIQISDNIQFCHTRKKWYHNQCPCDKLDILEMAWLIVLFYN